MNDLAGSLFVFVVVFSEVDIRNLIAEFMSIVVLEIGLISLSFWSVALTIIFEIHAFAYFGLSLLLIIVLCEFFAIPTPSYFWPLRALCYHFMRQPHRLSGPAIRINNETRFRIFGKPHRIGGPSEVPANALRPDHDGYALFGHFMHQQDYVKMTDNKSEAEIAIDMYIAHPKTRETIEQYLKITKRKHLIENLKHMTTLVLD